MISKKDKKNSHDYFIWKSNVLLNQNRLPFDLFSTLTQGRYLIETKNDQTSSYSYIYVWILNDNSFFKHLKYSINASIINVGLSLKDFYLDKNNCSKKIMYTYSLAENSISDDNFKELYNDVNIETLTVSNEHFTMMLDMLKASTSQLCESLKISKEYYFAII